MSLSLSLSPAGQVGWSAAAGRCEEEGLVLSEGSAVPRWWLRRAERCRGTSLSRAFLPVLLGVALVFGWGSAGRAGRREEEARSEAVGLTALTRTRMSWVG